jgi:transposase-like protein
MASKLTKEQVEYFSKCEYVESVTTCNIKFTNEFKEEFYKQYLGGKKPRGILTDFGIDANLLGNTRLNGLRNKILNKFGRNNSTPPKKSITRHFEVSQGLLNKTSELENNFKLALKKIAELEGLIEYQNQELTFLKKITCED